MSTGSVDRTILIVFFLGRKHNDIKNNTESVLVRQLV
jgi:hypothetical protein